MPPRKHRMQTMLDQPVTATPMKWAAIDQITPTKLMRATRQPKPVISRIGLVLMLVMPSRARPSILESG